MRGARLFAGAGTRVMSCTFWGNGHGSSHLPLKWNLGIRKPSCNADCGTERYPSALPRDERSRPLIIRFHILANPALSQLGLLC